MLFTEEQLKALNPTGVDYYFDVFHGLELPRFQFNRIEVDLDGFWYFDEQIQDIPVESLEELIQIISLHSTPD